MKRNLLFLLPIFMLSELVLAQTNKPAANTTSSEKGLSNAISLGASFPIDAFNRSHSAGIAIEYLRSKRRFGHDVLGFPLIAFAMQGGINYHPGRTSATAGYEFTYGNYLNFYTMAGVDCKLSTPIIINLTTGPLMSIYKGNADFGMGANLSADYYLSSRIAIGPGLFFRKFGNTDALWSGTIRASYAF